jgi:hypothetical protein
MISRNWLIFRYGRYAILTLTCLHVGIALVGYIYSIQCPPLETTQLASANNYSMEYFIKADVVPLLMDEQGQLLSANFDKLEMAATQFDKLAETQSIRCLSLHASKFDRHLVTKLTQNEQLEYLDLTATGLENKNLSEFGKFKSMRMLLLIGNQLTDEVCDIVNQMTELVVLDLAGTQLTVDGIRKLTNLKKLQVLNLYGTRVSTDIASVIQNFPEIRLISVGASHIKSEQFEALNAEIRKFDANVIVSLSPVNTTYFQRWVYLGAPSVSEYLRTGQDPVSEETVLYLKDGPPMVEEPLDSNGMEFGDDAQTGLPHEKQSQ